MFVNNPTGVTCHAPVFCGAPNEGKRTETEASMHVLPLTASAREIAACETSPEAGSACVTEPQL